MRAFRHASAQRRQLRSEPQEALLWHRTYIVGSSALIDNTLICFEVLVSAKDRMLKLGMAFSLDVGHLSSVDRHSIQHISYPSNS